MADKKQARAKVEEIADLGAQVSPKARAWLAKNRPALLLDQAKAACKPGGEGSCAEAGEALLSLHPGSPEGAEAKGLVDAEYARIYPRLKEVEHLLIQQVEVYDIDKRADICAESGPSDGHVEDRKQACLAASASPSIPTLDFLTKTWDKKLAEVGDPYYAKRFQERWAQAGSDGAYDPEPWPKPAGKK